MRAALAGLASVVLVVAAAAAAAAPRLVATIETGREPCGIAAGFGSIWTTTYGAGMLVRIDPRRNRVVQRIRVGPTACQVTPAFGSLWIARDGAAVLVRLNPRSLRRTAVRVEAAPFDVEAAFGSIWVACFGGQSVLRIDPATNLVVQRFPLGAAVTSLVAFRGRIWVGFGREARNVARIDPGSGSVSTTDVGVSQPAQLAVAGGTVWAATADDSVIRLDPETASRVATVAVPGTPAKPALGPDGALWAPAKAANTLTRINLATNRVIDVSPAGPGAFAVLNAYGSGWVPSFAGSNVWRFRAARYSRPAS